MSKTPNPRALDRDEADMVEQTKALAERTPAELRDLIGRLRARRAVAGGGEGGQAHRREKRGRGGVVCSSHFFFFAVC